jgi:uncharacterized protein (TIGR02270 family)
VVADASPHRGPLSHAPDRILWDVVEEHLDEAEYLVQATDEAHDSPLYRIHEIARGPEGRLLGHLDGLQVGGPTTAERVLLPVLEDDAEPPRVTAVALALLGSPERHVGQVLLDRLGDVSPAHRVGIVRALGMADRPDLDARLGDAARSGRAPRAALLHAMTLRGVDPGALLDACVHDEDPEVRLAAIEAARFGARRWVAWVETVMLASKAELRSVATATALVLGSRQAWELVGSLAFDAIAPDRHAMAWLAMFGDARQVQRIQGALDHEALRPHALWALGFSGRLAAADACVPWLSDAALGPLAGEAFAAITGLPRADDRYWMDREPEAESDELPPLQEDLDTELGMTPEDELPVPEPSAIARWWADVRPRLRADGRYLAGQPLDQAALLAGLAREPARRRHALAYELLVRTQGLARVQTRMLTSAQTRQSEALGSLPRIDGNRPFGSF